MKNHFDKYYKELIQFLVENNIIVEGDFVGLTKEEIFKLERALTINIPMELESYLSHFGQRMNLNYLGVSKYTKNNIAKAEKIANQNESKEKITQSEIVNVWDEELTKGELAEIITVSYLETTNYFTLLSTSINEASLFGWDNDEFTYKFNSTLFGELRCQIYTGLKRICDIRRDKSKLKPNTYSMDVYQNTKSINLSKFDWLSIYESRHVSNNHFVTSIHRVNTELFKSESVSRQYCNMKEYGKLVEIELNKRIKNSR